ncbi:MAG: ABC transporter permease [Chitinophagaceae bacterium]|jgi:hypothetical protein|nr:ABC transporter permease [Chitinophagaceae bacterium]
MKYTKYIGIVLGALYGLLFRIIGNKDSVVNFYNIYSITFVWVTPIVISLIPILFSKNELYNSKLKLVLYPVLAVLTFWILALSSGLEDWICLLIIGFPFFIVAGITGLIVGAIIKHNKINKKLYSIILLPLILNPIENLFPNEIKTYTITSSIVIDKRDETVWNNIIEVPEIKDNEYNAGLFNYLGVPRPIKSKIEQHDGNVYRVGYFTEHLKLYESISKEEKNRFVNFKMHIDKSQLRNKPTDQHILKSNNFKFENISYSLKPINENKTELTLKCEYTIESKMNGYANFWASSIIKDFEVRLLKSLKTKIENLHNL